MKRNIHKNLFVMLKSRGILAVAGGLLLMSCGAQMGGYSETDGVYYDPNKDTLPEGVIVNNQGNRVGEYYDYYQDDSNLIQNSQINAAEQDNRYNNWSSYDWNNNATDSDWGSFAGSQTNYYDNSWGWGMGWGSPWGWGSFGPGWGMGWSFGWGSPWGWNNGWGWGNPYWGLGWNNWYNPYWGGIYGNPYWGWGGIGYWGGYNHISYVRSGANGRVGAFRSNNASAYRKAEVNSGFRSNNGSGFRNGASNNGFRNGINNGGFRQRNTNGNFRGQGGFRNPNMNNNGVRSSRPNYNYNQQQSTPRRNDSYRPSDNGGFRSGGFNSGSSGGFRGGSSGGGGMRSGGGGGGFRSGGR